MTKHIQKKDDEDIREQIASFLPQSELEMETVLVPTPSGSLSIAIKEAEFHIKKTIAYANDFIKKEMIQKSDIDELDFELKQLIQNGVDIDALWIKKSLRDAERETDPQKRSKILEKIKSELLDAENSFELSKKLFLAAAPEELTKIPKEIRFLKSQSKEKEANGLYDLANLYISKSPLFRTHEGSSLLMDLLDIKNEINKGPSGVLKLKQFKGKLAKFENQKLKDAQKAIPLFRSSVELKLKKSDDLEKILSETKKIETKLKTNSASFEEISNCSKILLFLDKIATDESLYPLGLASINLLKKDPTDRYADALILLAEDISHHPTQYPEPLINELTQLANQNPKKAIIFANEEYLKTLKQLGYDIKVDCDPILLFTNLSQIVDLFIPKDRSSEPIKLHLINALIANSQAKVAAQKQLLESFLSETDPKIKSKLLQTSESESPTNLVPQSPQPFSALISLAKKTLSKLPQNEANELNNHLATFSNPPSPKQILWLEYFILKSRSSNPIFDSIHNALEKGSVNEAKFLLDAIVLYLDATKFEKKNPDSKLTEALNQLNQSFTKNSLNHYLDLAEIKEKVDSLSIEFDSAKFRKSSSKIASNSYFQKAKNDFEQSIDSIKTWQSENKEKITLSFFGNLLEDDPQEDQFLQALSNTSSLWKEKIEKNKIKNSDLLELKKDLPPILIDRLRIRNSISMLNAIYFLQKSDTLDTINRHSGRKQLTDSLEKMIQISDDLSVGKLPTGSILEEAKSDFELGLSLVSQQFNIKHKRNIGIKNAKALLQINSENVRRLGKNLLSSYKTTQKPIIDKLPPDEKIAMNQKVDENQTAFEQLLDSNDPSTVAKTYKEISSKILHPLGAANPIDGGYDYTKNKTAIHRIIGLYQNENFSLATKELSILSASMKSQILSDQILHSERINLCKRIQAVGGISGPYIEEQDLFDPFLSFGFSFNPEEILDPKVSQSAILFSDPFKRINLEHYREVMNLESIDSIYYSNELKNIDSILNTHPKIANSKLIQLEKEIIADNFTEELGVSKLSNRLTSYLLDNEAQNIHLSTYVSDSKGRAGKEAEIRQEILSEATNALASLYEEGSLRQQFFADKKKNLIDLLNGIQKQKLKNSQGFGITKKQILSSSTDLSSEFLTNFIHNLPEDKALKYVSDVAALGSDKKDQVSNSILKTLSDNPDDLWLAINNYVTAFSTEEKLNSQKEHNRIKAADAAKLILNQTRELLELSDQFAKNQKPSEYYKKEAYETNLHIPRARIPDIVHPHLTTYYSSLESVSRGLEMVSAIVENADDFDPNKELKIKRKEITLSDESKSVPWKDTDFDKKLTKIRGNYTERNSNFENELFEINKRKYIELIPYTNAESNKATDQAKILTKLQLKALNDSTFSDAIFEIQKADSNLIYSTFGFDTAFVYDKRKSIQNERDKVFLEFNSDQISNQSLNNARSYNIATDDLLKSMLRIQKISNESVATLKFVGGTFGIIFAPEIAVPIIFIASSSDLYDQYTSLGGWRFMDPYQKADFAIQSGLTVFGVVAPISGSISKLSTLSYRTRNMAEGLELFSSKAILGGSLYGFGKTINNYSLIKEGKMEGWEWGIELALNSLPLLGEGIKYSRKNSVRLRSTPLQVVEMIAFGFPNDNFSPLQKKIIEYETNSENSLPKTVYASSIENGKPRHLAALDAEYIKTADAEIVSLESVYQSVLDGKLKFDQLSNNQKSYYSLRANIDPTQLHENSIESSVKSFLELEYTQGAKELENNLISKFDENGKLNYSLLAPDEYNYFIEKRKSGVKSAYELANKIRKSPHLFENEKLYLNLAKNSSSKKDIRQQLSTIPADSAYYVSERLKGQSVMDSHTLVSQFRGLSVEIQKMENRYNKLLDQSTVISDPLFSHYVLERNSGKPPFEAYALNKYESIKKNVEEGKLKFNDLSPDKAAYLFYSTYKDKNEAAEIALSIRKAPLKTAKYEKAIADYSETGLASADVLTYFVERTQLNSNMEHATKSANEINTADDKLRKLEEKFHDYISLDQKPIFEDTLEEQYIKNRMTGALPSESINGKIQVQTKIEKPITNPDDALQSALSRIYYRYSTETPENKKWILSLHPHVRTTIDSIQNKIKEYNSSYSSENPDQIIKYAIAEIADKKQFDPQSIILVNLVLETRNILTPKSQNEEFLQNLTNKLKSIPGIGEEDLDGLVEIISKREKEGLIFGGVFGSRISYDLAGDYDLFFVAKREDLPNKKPLVMVEELSSGNKKSKVECLIIPQDLTMDETTDLKFQPISYVLLTHSLPLSMESESLISRLRSEVSPTLVKERYLDLAKSVVNIEVDGKPYERDDYWLWSTPGEKIVKNPSRQDFMALEKEPYKTNIALRAMRRAALDYLPRAAYLHEFGSFPPSSMTSHPELIEQIKLKNPELGEKLQLLGRVIYKSLSSEVFMLSDSALRNYIFGDFTKLEESLPPILSSQSKSEIHNYLEQTSQKKPSLTEGKHLRLLIFKLSQKDLHSYMNEILPLLK